MKNRWILNLILVAVVAILALLVANKPGKEPEEKTKRLTGLAIDSITRIRLTRPAKKEIIIEKKDSGWVVSKPLHARSNRFNVNNLLRVAETSSEAHFHAVESEFKQYGLDKPQARLWLNDTELQVGAKHPLKDSRYVLYNGQVHVIPAHRLRNATSPYTDFISPRLLEESRQLEHIKLPHADLTLVNGVWVLKPENKDLTADKINDFIEDWRHASALSVDRYSGKPVRQWIGLRFTGQEQEKKRLQLGIVSYAPEFILYRKDENLEYRFPEETGKRLMELKPD